MFDLASEELTNAIEDKINTRKEEIKMWTSLLKTQAQWIKLRETKC